MSNVHEPRGDSDAVPPSDRADLAAKPRSLWNDAVWRLSRNRMAIAGLIFVALLALTAVVGPWLSGHTYREQDPILGAQPPSRAHWLGTDEMGRDQLTRILYGARVSLAVGLAATLVSVVIGIAYGALAGYFGGRADMIMMRIVDVLYGLPFMLFVILLMMVVGRSIINLFIALGAVQWLTMARIVRGQVLSLKEEPFVDAARVAGAGPLRIIFGHLIPNLLGPVIVYATLNVPRIILDEAFLSFVGLGVQEPMPSWGSLVRDGAKVMGEFSWLILFPGAALSLTLLSFNFLGDGLRDALDPQAKWGRD